MRCTSCSQMLGCQQAAQFRYAGCRDFQEVQVVSQKDIASLLNVVEQLPDNLEFAPRSVRRQAAASTLLEPDPQHWQDEVDVDLNSKISSLLAGMADAEQVIKRVESGDTVHVSLSEYHGAMHEVVSLSAEYTKLLHELLLNDKTDVIGQLDDSDFPRAANIYDFMLGSNFLAATPYTAQLLFAVLLLEDYCPDCSNIDYFHNYSVSDTYAKLVDNICLLEYGVCPECGKTKTDFLRSGQHHFYTDLALMLGQRSGKSWLIVALFASAAHQVLKLQNPQLILGVDQTSALVATVCSSKLLQAKNALFKPLLSQMVVAPWFQDYGAFLRASRKKNGRELLSLNETSIRFRHRNFDILLEAANGETLRGPTRVCAAIDEYAHIGDDDPTSPLSATQVYTALRNSLKTIHGFSYDLIASGNRHDLYPAAQFNISSCSHARDPLVRQIALSKVNNQVLGIVKPTWEVNPKLPRKSFDGDFLNNPVEAARNYGSIPPATNSPFFDNVEMVKSSVRDYPVIPVAIRVGRGHIFKQAVTHAKLPEMRVPPPPGLSCISIDAGLNNNSFALVCHAIDEDLFQSYPYAFIEVQPLSKTMPIDFNHLTNQLLVPLARWCRARYLVADRWQSIHLLQAACTELSMGDHPQPCESFNISLKFDDLIKLKSRITDGSAILPLCPGPSDAVVDFDNLLQYVDDSYPKKFAGQELKHFYFQILTVRRIGRACLKGEGLTDDVFRAYAVGEHLLHSSDEFKLEMLGGNQTPPVPYAPLAAVVSSSSQTRSSSTGTGSVVAPVFSLNRKR